MPASIKAVTSILLAVACIAGICLAGFGIWLICLGARGISTIYLFGQLLDTTETGIPAFLIGQVLIILILLAVLRVRWQA